MYCNDIISQKVRILVSKLTRKKKVRPFREVTEIAPLLQDEQEEKRQKNGSQIYPELDTIAEDTEMGTFS